MNHARSITNFFISIFYQKTSVVCQIFEGIAVQDIEDITKVTDILKVRGLIIFKVQKMFYFG